MDKKKLKKVAITGGIFAGVLLTGVSLNHKYQQIAEQNADDFAKTEIVINRKPLSIQDFYDNLELRSGKWYYTDEEGNKFDVDSLCNSQNRNMRDNAHYRGLKLKSKTDTVYVTYKDQQHPVNKESNMIYKVGVVDSLPNRPSMGLLVYDLLTIREFIADNPDLQYSIDVYNDTINCTRDHELQHYKNTLNGMREWNSYSIKFVECCQDEISANLKQCLSQIERYKQTGDTRYLKRFKFLQPALISGELKGDNPLSKEEQSLIFNGVFEAWMKEKFPIYATRNNNRTINMLRNADYMSVINNWDLHNSWLDKAFSMNDCNFAPYMKQRESEIFAEITFEQKTDYLKRDRRKFKKMDYIEQLEYLKYSQGDDAYKQKILNDYRTAKLINFYKKQGNTR